MKMLPWIAANAPGWWRFRLALADPRGEQEAILRRYLRRNAETAFGREYGFAKIRTVAEYQERVPLAGYADFEPWIERVAGGERNVLTRSPLRALEVTSGSSSAAKRIPYTGGLQAEIRRAVAPWIFDLYRHRPRLALGCAYWSITPPVLEEEEEEKEDGAVPTGFAEDAEYLGGFWKRLVDSTLAVPGSVRFARDIDTFRSLTLGHLLRRRDLTLISVWHPSFLTLLMAELPRFWDGLLHDLETTSPRRAAELRRIPPTEPVRIWPHLGLISCWGDGHAALHLDELRTKFPGVEIQPKGLLATEGFVTIPFGDHHPLALRSHFFEFLPDGEERESGGRPLLAHRLEAGGVYSVVLTTGGGLYRYRLHDRVSVSGFVARTPSLRFLGREGHTSDRRGEKLQESFVAGALARVFRRLDIAPRFALLAPHEPEGSAPRYVLYLESQEPAPADLPAALDQELEANPHYRTCLRLGQLAPAAVFEIGADGAARYLAACRKQGQRLGDIKPLALSNRADWHTVFRERRPAKAV